MRPAKGGEFSIIHRWPLSMAAYWILYDPPWIPSRIGGTLDRPSPVRLISGHTPCYRIVGYVSFMGCTYGLRILLATRRKAVSA